MFLQRGRAGGGELVGLAPVFRGQRCDEPVALEPGEDLVEGAGGEADAGEAFDVLGQRVAVLGTFGEAGEDQRGGAGVLPEVAEAVGRWHA